MESVAVAGGGGPVIGTCKVIEFSECGPATFESEERPSFCATTWWSFGDRCRVHGLAHGIGVPSMINLASGGSRVNVTCIVDGVMIRQIRRPMAGRRMAAPARM